MKKITFVNSSEIIIYLFSTVKLVREFLNFDPRNSEWSTYVAWITFHWLIVTFFVYYNMFYTDFHFETTTGRYYSYLTSPSSKPFTSLSTTIEKVSARMSRNKGCEMTEIDTDIDVTTRNGNKNVIVQYVEYIST